MNLTLQACESFGCISFLLFDPVVRYGAGCVLMQSLMGETPKTALHRCQPWLRAGK
ncbi:hypothetical protein [Moorena sp. SIO4G3]|uniref:hypothetical protein n=1 Tax=Moorena sp. SIO4G3 TaxID=2607821 RepID=UPI0025E5B72C|nr:hypothetical protein [Moorena sp. SIO4G3]